MDPNRYNGIGEEIKKMVSDAVGSQNFDRLSENISKTVNSAISSAGTELRRTGEALKNSFSSQTQQGTPFPVNVKAIPSGYGMPSFILGLLGTAVFGALLLIMLMGLALGIDSTAGPSVLLTVLTALCIIFASRGFRAMRLKKHFKRYMMLMSREKYFLIDDIAKAFPLKRSAAVKELSGLIAKGAFPQGHIDKHRKYFIGDDDTYQYYMQSAEREKQLAKDPETAKKADQTRAVIEKGREYIYSIRHANDIIIDKEISDKLDTTELILKNIFDRLEKRPDLVPEVRKLIEYYLPITEKLLNAYIELDRQNIDSDNIKHSKDEIEKSLDAINTAFYNLYNSLFADDKVDIVSDINVLKAMFAQEGLNNSDFKKQEG